MTQVPPNQLPTTLPFLITLHLIIITASNYLVQLPITIFGVHTTWGAFSFPFIFLVTDLTVRVYGALLARRIILCVMIPTLFISYCLLTLFYQGEWRQLAALKNVNVVAARIACACFLAYMLGQLLDIRVFNRFRRNAIWWIAPAASMFVGNIIDTFAFFFIAFYRSSDSFMATHWVEIALADYLVKFVIGLLFFLPTYGIVLRVLLRYLTKTYINSTLR